MPATMGSDCIEEDAVAKLIPRVGTAAPELVEDNKPARSADDISADDGFASIVTILLLYNDFDVPFLRRGVIFSSLRGAASANNDVPVVDTTISTDEAFGTGTTNGAGLLERVTISLEELCTKDDIDAVCDVLVWSNSGAPLDRPFSSTD
ncbi:hypothetical protein HAP94_11345 [Acidithiobacillus ferrivorans]|nr:hypothetical protein [Acidithiobacillus ferrivorans]